MYCLVRLNQKFKSSLAVGNNFAFLTKQRMGQKERKVFFGSVRCKMDHYLQPQFDPEQMETVIELVK